MQFRHRALIRDHTSRIISTAVAAPASGLSGTAPDATEPAPSPSPVLRTAEPSAATDDQAIAARIRDASAAAPPDDRVTLVHRAESDGFDFWATAWVTPDGSVLCVATVFGRYCTSARTVDHANVSAVLFSGSPYYPSAILVGPVGVSAKVAFEDGSTTTVDFLSTPRASIGLAVLPYPPELAGGSATVVTDSGRTTSIGLIASTATVVAPADGRPLLPPGLFPPSDAAPTHGGSATTTP